MPVFKKSIFFSECDRCHVRFHIGAGGVCERCRKILCDNHLHGSLVRRIQSGNIRSYAGWLALGAAAVIIVMIFGHSFWLHSTN